jgi:signal transduction histidine kinase
MFKATIAIMALMTATNILAADVCSKAEVERKVKEVCQSIEEKGEAVKSEWPTALKYSNCGDNYVWVQDTSPEMLMIMHPVKSALNGKPLVKIPDEKGFVLFAAFDKEAKAKPAGAWVNYVWKKPGSEAAATPKISFVKLCKMKSGTTWLAGSGLWNEDLK